MLKKKKSISTNGSENKLSYLETYEEIEKYLRTSYKKQLKAKHKKFKNQKDFMLSRGVRWFLFVIFIFLQILMNWDHGTVPAATDEIRWDLKIDDDTLGVFGSLVFLGNLIGSLISLSFINRYNRKFLLIISLLLNGLCLYTFTVTDIVWLLFANRIIVGIFQAFVSIYLPVWCDQFGIRNKKTIMISFIQAGSPIGVVLGYFITCLIKDSLGWSYSFIFQAILVGFTILILIFVPSIYFSSTLLLSKRKEYQINTHEDEISIYRDSSIVFDSRPASSDTIDAFDENGNPIPNSFSIFRNLCYILKQKVYMFSALSLASLFFVITAVQYWGSDYMERQLKIDDKNLRLLSFSTICITSPTFGVIFGGWLGSLVGGYESKHCISVCLILALLSGICCIPLPFMDNLLEFTILLWLVLFFGGAILPPLTGVIISTLPARLRGSANSITSFFSNALGYLPAPYIYGLINKNLKEYYDKIAFMSVMYYSWVGVFFLSIACYFRHQQYNKDGVKPHSAPNERKTSTGSIISNNIAKVFGNYLNLDHSELKLCEEPNLSNNYSTDAKQKRKVKVYNKSQLLNNSDDDFDAKENEDQVDEFHHDNEAHIKKLYNPPNTAHHSLYTPQFNILHNGNDFDYIKQQMNENPNNINSSKEESIFAPKMLKKRLSIESINLNIEKVCKSFNDKSELIASVQDRNNLDDKDFKSL